jgi:O-antigen/teichoic acid export membrane protein
MPIPDAESGNAATEAVRNPASAVAAADLLPARPAASDNSASLKVAIPWEMPFDRLRAWAFRGGSSVLQQGLFAGAHFLTNVLLARWLAPASYGAFALAYSVFLLLLAFYMALFYEPVLVYGPGRYASTFSTYIRVLVRAHFLLLLPMSLLIAFAAPLLGRFYTHEFQLAFLALTVVSPLLLLVWLCRAAFYAQLNPHAGAVAGACYFVLLVLCIWILQRGGMLSPATALGGMAGGSLLVSAGCLYRFRKQGEQAASIPELKFARVVSDHWHYGRWAWLTAVASWIPANIYYALLPARFGLESTAMLRALMNLMYPLLHTVSPLVTLLIPILVRQRERNGLQRMKRTVLQLVALFVPAGVLYLLFLAAFRAPILHLLYAGRYNNVSAWAAVSIGILPITSGIAYLLGAALRALERPHLIFWSYLASTIAALAVGIPVTLHYGVSGAAFALVLNDLPTIVVLAVCLARCKEATGAPA